MSSNFVHREILDIMLTKICMSSNMLIDLLLSLIGMYWHCQYKIVLHIHSIILIMSFCDIKFLKYFHKYLHGEM